jgi:hypothetical protein
MPVDLLDYKKTKQTSNYPEPGAARRASVNHHLYAPALRNAYLNSLSFLHSRIIRAQVAAHEGEQQRAPPVLFGRGPVGIPVGGVLVAVSSSPSSLEAPLFPEQKAISTSELADDAADDVE